MENQSNSSGVRVEIAWTIILKLLLGVLLAFVAFKLWLVFKLCVVSILLAVPLYQLVRWTCHKGWPRWIGLLAASLFLVVAALSFAAIVGPLAFTQASDFADE